MKATSPTFKLRRLATILAVAVLTFGLIAATSGILLSFYYEPTASGAYNSLKTVAEEVPYGWLIRRMHDISGNFLIIASLIQVGVMFLGERLKRSWFVAWVSIIFLALSAIALGWTSMILDWSQLGYWRFRIELGTIESIPLIGNQLQAFLTGGAFNSLTVKRLYTLHSYVLSTVALVLAVIHLVSLFFQDKEEKQDIEPVLTSTS
jgi:cytochrome b6